MADIVADGPWAGWICYVDPDSGTFLSLIGPSYSRADSKDRVAVMVETRSLHRNRMDRLHGGFIAAVADHAGFAALNAVGRPEQVNGVTVDLSVQFMGTGRVGPPLCADVEILRETGRLFFMRMTFRQDEDLIAAASVTLRKVRETA